MSTRNVAQKAVAQGAQLAIGAAAKVVRGTIAGTKKTVKGVKKAKKIAKRVFKTTPTKGGPTIKGGRVKKRSK